MSKESLSVDFQTELALGPKIAEGGAAVIHQANIRNEKLLAKHGLKDDTVVIAKILKGTLEHLFGYFIVCVL